MSKNGIQANIHLLQAGISGYCLFEAYNAISKLRTWEPTAEKAAEFSDAAKKDLQKTRSTQTSGALAILTSLLGALWILAFPPEPDASRFFMNIAIATICFLARTHVSRFWKNKQKFPGATSYNDAINSTIVIKNQLGILAFSWFMTAIFEAETARRRREAFAS